MSGQSSIPIIRLYDTLVVSIQVDLSDSLIASLKDELCAEIQRTGARGLVIEVSGFDVFDSYIARSIRDLAHVARLMGAETILAGLKAGMAVTMVEMDLTLRGIRSVLNLEAAIEHFRRAERAKEAEDQELALALMKDDGQS